MSSRLHLSLLVPCQRRQTRAQHTHSSHGGSDHSCHVLPRARKLQFSRMSMLRFLLALPHQHNQHHGMTLHQTNGAVWLDRQ